MPCHKLKFVNVYFDDNVIKHRKFKKSKENNKCNCSFLFILSFTSEQLIILFHLSSVRWIQSSPFSTQYIISLNEKNNASYSQIF